MTQYDSCSIDYLSVNNNHVRVGNELACQSSAFTTPEPDIEEDWEPLSDCVVDSETSTSAVLHYCKQKIIIPYQRFLTLLGWRPFVSNEESQLPVCLLLASRVYVMLVVFVILVGYVLQYAACFRRDLVDGYKGFHEGAWHEEPTPFCRSSASAVIGVYLIPNMLHTAAYLHTFYLFRICDNEQLQTLMERVFLQAFNSRSGYVMQHKLIGILRAFWVLGLCWVALSSVGIAMRIVTRYPNFSWIHPKEGSDYALVAVLSICLLWNDVTHAAIIMNYSIQCQLLIGFLRGVTDRILEKSISILEAIKDIHEAAKMVKYLNEDFAVAVSLLILHSANLALCGVIWFVVRRQRGEELLVIATNIVCTTAWMLIFLFPLIQASRLTAACGTVAKLGILLQTRPFGYQECLQQQLDTFLLFTSSLKLKAKLFSVPVNPTVLFSTLAIGSLFLLLILTQCDLIYKPT